jgi:hypothetical protein
MTSPDELFSDMQTESVGSSHQQQLPLLLHERLSVSYTSFRERLDRGHGWSMVHD